MNRLCKKCKKPFVAEHLVAVWGGNARAVSEYCPDCSANMGAKPDVDLDCYQYTTHHRLTARLRDGYQILAEAETE
jgi:hypothetical protein